MSQWLTLFPILKEVRQTRKLLSPPRSLQVRRIRGARGVTQGMLLSHLRVWARTVVSEHDWIEQPTMARTLIAEGLRRITHSDILADMMHDGYGVEQDTIDRVMKYGLPRSKRYVCQPAPLW
jgi:hypothetical protein